MTQLNNAEHPSAWTSRCCITLAWAIVFAIINPNPSRARAGDLHWEANDQGVLIRDGERDVLFYQRASKSKNGKYNRANYIHPLHDLDGNILTEDFPDDHRHHRGVFWAWHQLRVADQPIGDGWATQNFIWDVRQVDVIDGTDGSIVIHSTVDWKSDDWKGGAEAVVTERCSIRVHPVSGEHRYIDFDIRLRANQGETFIGGSDDEKGYGGFSVRIGLPPDLRFVSQNGSMKPRTGPVAASPWMSMIGTYGQTGQTGLTVLTHGSSVGYPQTWILRSSRSMQNAVWPGRDVQRLPQEDSLPLRYRLVIHRDAAEPDVIDRWQREYQFEEAKD